MSSLRQRWRIITHYRLLLSYEAMVSALLKEARERGRAEAASEIIDKMWQAHESAPVRLPLNGGGSGSYEQLIAHMAIACRVGHLSPSQITDKTGL